MDSFMACYLKIFHFYTMLWNKCGPIFIEKSVHYTPKRHNLKTIISPSQDPKKLNDIDFIG